MGARLSDFYDKDHLVRDIGIGYSPTVVMAGLCRECKKSWFITAEGEGSICRCMASRLSPNSDLNEEGDW